MTSQIVFDPATNIHMKRSRWLWEDHIFDNSLAAFAGPGGTGKSTYVLDFVARLTRGTVPGEHHGEPLTVGVWESEDPAAEITVPRLHAADADLERVYLIKGTRRESDDHGELVTGIRMPEDETALREFIITTGANIIVISPFANVIGGDLNKRENVAHVLARLTAIADELKVTFLLILHFNKGGGSMQDKISGSAAFRDHVRATFLFAHDDESGQRVITHDKGNYSATTGASFAFALESVEIPVSDGLATVARVVDLGESDVSVGDIINRDQEGADGSDDRNAAQAFVLDYLKGTEAYEAPASAVLKAGRGAGFSENEVKNARKRMKNPCVASRKSGFGAGWVWALEGVEGVEGVEGARPGEGATFAEDAQGVDSPGGDPFDTFDTFGTDGDPFAPSGSSTSTDPSGPQTCSHPLLSPRSQELGICARCAPDKYVTAPTPTPLTQENTP